MKAEEKEPNKNIQKTDNEDKDKQNNNEVDVIP